MDKNLQDKLLHSFPNTEYMGIIREYDAGRSGSPVFAVKFRPKNKISPQYGLNGTFIVKIGSKDWANAEQVFFNDSATGALTPLLARLHMLSDSIEGQVAVAYDVAFGSLIEPKPLMSVLDEGSQSEGAAQKQIQDLCRTLVDWYLGNDISDNSIVRDPHTLLYRMLTPKRTGDMVKKLGKELPFWKPDPLQITVEGLNRSLPNPLAYMKQETWSKIRYNQNCPIGRIHGDLHTGNIICLPKSRNLPKVIDFGQSVPDGVPFFDLAYLEFDVMQHLLSVEQVEDRKQWLSLLDFSMTGILRKQQRLPWDAARAWRFIRPIRQEVKRLQEVDREYFEIVWWLATIAVGLNFARKGRETRPRLERIAGLLYAAYGLERMLHIYEIEELATEDKLFVPWIRGTLSHLISSELRPSTVPPATPHENLCELDKSAQVPVGGSTESAPVETPMRTSEVVPIKTLHAVQPEQEQAAAPKPVTRQREEQVNQPSPIPVNKIIVFPTRPSEDVILAIKTHYNDLVALQSSIVSIGKLFDETKKIQDDQYERIMNFFRRVKEPVDQLLLEIERLPQGIKPNRFPFRKELRSIHDAVDELQLLIADSKRTWLQPEIVRAVASLSQHFEDLKGAFDELGIGGTS